jgi:hypothetical protein
MEHSVKKYEFEYNGKIYQVTINELNKPSESAIKDCREKVNKIMRRILNG